MMIRRQSDTANLFFNNDDKQRKLNPSSLNFIPIQRASSLLKVSNQIQKFITKSEIDMNEQEHI